MSQVTLCPGCHWSSGGAGGAQVELVRQSRIPQVRLSWTIFFMDLADFTSMEEELLGFVCNCVFAIFYQMREKVSRCDSADYVFLKFFVGPKFSIDEGWSITKLRVFLSISAEAACWVMQTTFCWFRCRGGNPFEQKKSCFNGLWCWFVNPPWEHWLRNTDWVEDMECQAQRHKSHVFLTQSVHAKSGMEELFGFCERVTLIWISAPDEFTLLYWTACWLLASCPWDLCECLFD